MRKNKTMIFWFCLPALLCLLIMFVYPVCRTVIMSFFAVESVTATTADWTFNGLSNYFKIFGSASFLTSMQNMLLIWIVGGVFTLLLAMLMAVVVTSGIRGKKFFRAAIYMPNIISAVALATMWIQYMFQYDVGLLNQIVQLFGGEKVKWLGTDLKFWAMTGSFIFGSVGYYMLIYISGIEGIPQDLYEAATIDGAGKVKQFFTITLPMVSPTLFVVMIMRLMSSIKVYDLIYMMVEDTNPAVTSVQSLMYLFYRSSFVSGDRGYGSAIVIWTVGLILLVTLFQFWAQKKWVNYDI